MSAPLPPTAIPPASKRRRWVLPVAVVAFAIALAAGVLIAHGRAHAPAIDVVGAGSATAEVGAAAPNGTFTTTSGNRETIASLRGHSTMVWFVANGCASCAVSIPAVAQHFAQLEDYGVQVLTLGLYGAFDSGKRGAAELVAFGRDAASTNVQRPGWTWGMPSEALTMAYDPTGTPDEYFLIDPDGRIVYHNSVPVSTMGQLLAATGRLGFAQSQSG
jgi:peroxiredoxin